MIRPPAAGLNLSDFTIAADNMDDPRLGVIDIMYHKTNPQFVIFTKIKTCQSEEEFQLTKEVSVVRLNMIHDNLLRMVDLQANESNREIFVAFEYPSDDLYSRLEELRDPQELLKFLYQMLSVLSFLETNQTIHGNLRPEFIFYQPRTQNYVLIDRLSDVNGPLEAMLESLKKGGVVFLPPVFFEELVRGNMRINHNPFKIETFVLGMIILASSCEIKTYQTIYDVRTGKFNYDVFQSCCEATKNNFIESGIPIEIWNFIAESLLDLNVNNRSTAISALKKMTVLLSNLQKAAQRMLANKDQGHETTDSQSEPAVQGTGNGNIKNGQKMMQAESGNSQNASNLQVNQKTVEVMSNRSGLDLRHDLTANTLSAQVKSNKSLVGSTGFDFFNYKNAVQGSNCDFKTEFAKEERADPISSATDIGSQNKLGVAFDSGQVIDKREGDGADFFEDYPPGYVPEHNQQPVQNESPESIKSLSKDIVQQQSANNPKNDKQNVYLDQFMSNQFAKRLQSDQGIVKAESGQNLGKNLMESGALDDNTSATGNATEMQNNSHHQKAPVEIQSSRKDMSASQRSEQSQLSQKGHPDMSFANEGFVRNTKGSGRPNIAPLAQNNLVLSPESSRTSTDEQTSQQPTKEPGMIALGTQPKAQSQPSGRVSLGSSGISIPIISNGPQVESIKNFHKKLGPESQSPDGKSNPTSIRSNMSNSPLKQQIDNYESNDRLAINSIKMNPIPVEKQLFSDQLLSAISPEQPGKQSSSHLDDSTLKMAKDRLKSDIPSDQSVVKTSFKTSELHIDQNATVRSGNNEIPTIVENRPGEASANSQTVLGTQISGQNVKLIRSSANYATGQTITQHPSSNVTHHYVVAGPNPQHYVIQQTVPGATVLHQPNVPLQQTISSQGMMYSPIVQKQTVQHHPQIMIQPTLRSKSPIVGSQNQHVFIVSNQPSVQLKPGSTVRFQDHPKDYNKPVPLAERPSLITGLSSNRSGGQQGIVRDVSPMRTGQGSDQQVPVQSGVRSNQYVNYAQGVQTMSPQIMSGNGVQRFNPAPIPGIVQQGNLQFVQKSPQQQQQMFRQQSPAQMPLNPHVQRQPSPIAQRPPNFEQQQQPSQQAQQKPKQ